jgi:serine/threonine-protein kinase
MLDIGARLGSYHIEARLGAGGMGEVYRARDTRLGRDVAIKVLPEGSADDAERNARFEREAKLLAALNHVNIAQIYGFESTGGSQFLIMELVDGETLAERIARGAVPPDVAFRIAHQIAEGLEAAHEKGIVHRDLKPANIKTTPDGKVKVLDFGLARALEGSTPAANTLSPTLSIVATNAGLILGTAGYMSPEQARGHAADQRSDVFSFGCILFEMLTGRQTFPGETITDVIAAIVARDPDWRALPPALHPRALELIRRCLVKDRKQRWHSIGDVRVELEAILADPNGSEAPAGHRAPAAPLRNRIAGMTAAALIGALTATAATYFATRPVRESKPIVRFPVIVPADQSLQATPRNVLAVSPDGRRIVYATNRGLFLRNLDDSQARLLAGTEQGAAPFFSPDGQWVGFLARDQNKLKKIAITGGAPGDIGEATALELHGPVWNSDNYIYWGRPGSVQRMSADGGKAEAIIRLKEGETAHRPQLLPDGDGLLFTLTTETGREGWDTAQIVVESITSHERQVVVRGGTDGRYLPTGHLLYARGPDLLAAPFDLRTKRTGTGIPIVEDVRRALSANAGGADAQAAVANDGSLVYVAGSDGLSEDLVLTVVDQAGKRRPVNVPPGAHSSPGLSPLGGQITFSTNDGREQSIWVGDLSGKDPPRKLTYDQPSSRPLWSPNADRVFYSVSGDKPAIYSQRVAGGPAEKVVDLPPDTVAQLEGWLPDRMTLLYTERQPGAAGSKGIFMLRPGQKPQLLVAPPASNSSVSPDGQWLAYAKQIAGRTEVFIEPLPPNGDIRQITFNGAGNPLWSRDGRQLFMVAFGSRQLLAVDIENGLPKGAIRPLPIEGIATPGPRPYDVSADGKSFLVMFSKRAETTDVPADRIEVTLNWFEELKARARAE